MKAVVYDSPRNFTVTEVPTPEPAANEVLIKVTQTGICGTDLHIHEGDFYAAFPLIPGHEVVGVVSEIGADVTTLTVGQRVSVNPNINCGGCHFCRSGRPLLCSDLKGIGTNWPGAFAEYLTAPEDYVYSVDGLDDDTAVFTEPAACAMHGLETLTVKPGSTALVFGAGPTGLLLAQLLVSGGAAKVTVAASSAFKLERATALGVDDTYLMNRETLDTSVSDLLERSGGEGFDIVVDATGSPAVSERTVGLTRSGGTVMFYGVTGPDDRVSLSPYDIFRREITIKGSFAEISAFPATIQALHTGRARTDGIITHRFSLDEYGAAMETLRSDPTAHKIVIVP
ncbi:zinc-dependent alcohol dehydrogenase family protein [Lysinibacter cavernae]|uniref:D-arabinitol dehydrogenase (NADP+) n=1 Tax=Lysinibacter cavernae TaxID=1640652 RepID=A0A7X5R028_9MICO|nr:zinc-dependent alcohol dehydrogenase family protein [Lysinibacter cavernae]NIH53149.1 D-arabinitol dehydrogenase (NADP+) [Lysinibacter cavernae]